MKKILVVLMIALLTLAMAACGGSSSDSAGGMTEESKDAIDYGGLGDVYMENSAESPEESYSYDSDAPAAAEGSGETRNTGNGVSVGLPKSLNKSDVKLIYTADISVQTLDFNEAVKGLTSLTEKVGGYFESVDSDNGSYYYEESYKYGRYTVRVPSDKFQEFVNSLSEGMHVVNIYQSAQDIGQMYFDTERRIETLKNKHDRLEELLKKASKMSDIIELESALSDTEYELEEYTSELRRYDSLVSYSTVNVSIEQVSQYDKGVQEELTFGERFLKSVESGFADFGGWIEDVIVWIGYNVIQLVILAVIIIVLVKFHVISKIKGLFGGKKKHDYVIVDKKEDTDKK